MSPRWTMAALAALWVAVLASAVAVVHAKQRSRALFVQLEQLSAERDALNVEWWQVQLEQSAWSNHGFVESMAARRLGMKVPGPNDVRIVKQ